MNTPINVNLDNCPSVQCPCGNETFHLIHFLKRIPGIMIGQTTDQFMPIPVYECVRCRKLLDFGKLAKEPADQAQKSTNPIKNFLSNF